jgi:hypothetical protein
VSHVLRWLLALAPAVVGCNAIVSPDVDQCATDDDCEARGFSGALCEDAVCVEPPEDPIWGCLGDVVEPTPDPSKTIDFPIRLALAIDGAPVAEAVVDICDKLDVGCVGEDPKYPKGVSPNAEGVVNVKVPEGFDGFVRIAEPTIVDSRVYVGRPIVVPPSVKEVQLFRPEDIELLATLTGVEPDPTRGSAVVLGVDCSGIAASGVSFEVTTFDSGALAFYLINQLPVLPPGATATDKDGFGGFFNLKTGSAVVSATRELDGVYVGESGFQILANTISYVQVGPTPQ